MIRFVYDTEDLLYYQDSYGSQYEVLYGIINSIKKLTFEEIGESKITNIELAHLSQYVTNSGS